MLLKTFILTISLYATLLAADKVFYLDPSRLTFYNSKSSCPRGYRLAILDSPQDWLKAGELALNLLGYQKAVWIRYGLGWRGVGNERWSLVTPNTPNSCPFPPKDLKSFCVPFYRFRLSSNRKRIQPKLPSLCEKIA